MILPRRQRHCEKMLASASRLANDTRRCSHSATKDAISDADNIAFDELPFDERML